MTASQSLKCFGQSSVHGFRPLLEGIGEKIYIQISQVNVQIKTSTQTTGDSFYSFLEWGG